MTNQTNVTIRDVDVRMLRKFKAEAVHEGLKFGEAFVDAVRCWLARKKGHKGKRASLLDLKPADYGPGSERMSEEIDEYLYGGKR